MNLIENLESENYFFLTMADKICQGQEVDTLDNSPFRWENFDDDDEALEELWTKSLSTHIYLDLDKIGSADSPPSTEEFDIDITDIEEPDVRKSSSKTEIIPELSSDDSSTDESDNEEIDNEKSFAEVLLNKKHSDKKLITAKASKGKNPLKH